MKILTQIKKQLGYIIVLLIIAAGCFIAYYTSVIIKTAGSVTRTGYENLRSFHIIVTGTRTDADFLQKLYEGAAKAADEYDAAVELIIPTTQAEDVSIYDLLDYAAYVGADGIIVYNEDENIIIDRLLTVRKTEIPVVVVGTDNVENEQICFIGMNKYELGKIAAQTILDMKTKPANIYAIEYADKSTETVNRVLASMKETFHPVFDPHIRIIRDIQETDFIRRNEQIRSKIASLETDCVVFCFSANDTIFAAQAVIDFHMIEDVTIIGLYKNSETQKYLSKGIIHTVISADAERIGSQAMDELFMWKRNGYANRYIAADIQLFTGDSMP